MTLIFIVGIKINFMEITVGHTPDADDAFMFYGMLSGKVSSPDFKVNHVVEDIETLNKHALNHELDVTAVSAHACAYIKDYTVLRSGGSFGKGYGPIVTAKQNNLVKILDTGTWWRDSTGGLPVPLGVNVMSNHFGIDTIKNFDAFFRESIVYGMARVNDAVNYAMQYSRGQSKDLIERFVRM